MKIVERRTIILDINENMHKLIFLRGDKTIVKTETPVALKKDMKLKVWQPTAGAIMRQNLNNLITVALKYFGEDKFELFLIEISKDYGIRNRPRKLITFVKNKEISIDPNKIVEELLYHEFRPDGIAYILNIMGEALLQLKDHIEIYDYSRYDLISLAIRIFKTIYMDNGFSDKDKSDKRSVQKKGNILREKANTLDEQIKQFKKSRFPQINKIWQRINNSIPEEYMKEYEKGTFIARVEEMMNIARINCAICYIIYGSIENLKIADRMIKEAITIIWENKETFRFFGNPETRIQALEDWLLTLGIDIDFNEESTFRPPGLLCIQEK